MFLFGNLIGDTGDSPTNLRVSALDLGAVKRALNTNATVTSTTDINRDGRINALDLAAVKRWLNQAVPIPAVPIAGLPTFASFAYGGTAPTRRIAEEVLA